MSLAFMLRVVSISLIIFMVVVAIWTEDVHWRTVLTLIVLATWVTTNHCAYCHGGFAESGLSYMDFSNLEFEEQLLQAATVILMIVLVVMTAWLRDDVLSIISVALSLPVLASWLAMSRCDLCELDLDDGGFGENASLQELNRPNYGHLW